MNNSPACDLPLFLRHVPLPKSISALRQKQKTSSKTHWADKWKKSPRHEKAKRLGLDVPCGAFIKLVSSLSKTHMSLLVWLYTGHISLNHHLHRIRISDTAACPLCSTELTPVPETTHHFILECPNYARERQYFRNSLGCQAHSLPHLLTHPGTIGPLIRYVNSTKHLKRTFGNVPPKEQN